MPTKLLSLVAEFDRTNPVVERIVQEIEELSPQSIDKIFQDKAPVTLSLDTTGDQNLRLSCGAAWVAVTVPEDASAPATITAALPSSDKKLSFLSYHADGVVREGDDATIIANNAGARRQLSNLIWTAKMAYTITLN